MSNEKKIVRVRLANGDEKIINAERIDISPSGVLVLSSFKGTRDGWVIVKAYNQPEWKNAGLETMT